MEFRYFVTFIDDFSRCTWLFSMKTQAKLFSTFQKFHVKVQTQFNTSIRILRSDNAKEYIFGIVFKRESVKQGIFMSVRRGVSLKALKRNLL